MNEALRLVPDPARLRIADLDLASAFLREAVDPEHVERLAQVIDQLPPPVVFGRVVADGVHTVEAHRSLRHEDIAVDLRPGGVEEARRYAATANLHGENSERPELRRSNPYKRAAVLILLESGSDESAGAIAEKLGVSQPFVSELIKEWETQSGSELRSRVGKDGRRINTSKIGKDVKVEALAFVARATSTGHDSSFISLGHGTAYASNIFLAASAPFPLSFNCQVKASDLMRAVKGARSVSVERRLADDVVEVVRGALRIPLTTTTREMARVIPEGIDVSVPGLLPALETARLRVHDRGLLLDGATLRTGSVALALAAPFFDRAVRLPHVVCVALSGIEEPPSRAQLSDKHLTLNWGERWLRIALLDTALTDQEKEVERSPDAAEVQVPPELFDALDLLRPHADGVVVLDEGEVCAKGARVAVADLPALGPYPLDELLRWRPTEEHETRLWVVPGGDLFVERGPLRGRVMRGDAPDPPELKTNDCPTCGQPWVVS